MKREKDGIEQQLAETRVKIEETQRELDSEKVWVAIIYLFFICCIIDLNAVN